MAPRGAYLTSLAWADRETGASAKGVIHLFATRSRFQRLVGHFKSQNVFLVSHGIIPFYCQRRRQ
jgi:hypothetical protein